MSTTIESPSLPLSSQTEGDVQLRLVQAATSTFTIERFPMEWATAPETPADDDWDEYIRFEALRRGISVAVVREENAIARKKLARIKLDSSELREAARNAPSDHPYMVGDDEPCPF
jgi:hypothetical protein